MYYQAGTGGSEGNLTLDTVTKRFENGQLAPLSSTWKHSTPFYWKLLN